MVKHVVVTVGCVIVGNLALCSATSTLPTHGSRRRASKVSMHRGLHPLQGDSGTHRSPVEIISNLNVVTN